MQQPIDRWLLLIHQLPAKPDYLRVKIGRRLSRLGAVPIKNSVYLLPNEAERVEDLQWVLREIAEGGGEGTLAVARFLGGLDDGGAEELFRTARDQDCGPVLGEARALLDRGAPQVDERAAFEAELARLKRRQEEIAAVDWFGSTRRLELEGVLRALSALLDPEPDQQRPEIEPGRTWVTRRGIKVDRMASAWLVRRFIDPDARFKFVEAKGYVPRPGEIRFDMFDAEYTHEGDLCTFEVLVRRFGLTEAGLVPLAEIVHDVDVKDGKHGRAEAAGIAAVVDAIAVAHPGDEDRLARAGAVLDDLFRSFAR